MTAEQAAGVDHEGAALRSANQPQEPLTKGTPGPELDALVAEKVMGWAWRKWNVSGSEEPVKALFPPTWAQWVGTEPCDAGSPIRRAVGTEGRIRPYSTDIAAAWLVVEKMATDGWFPEVQFNNWGAESWNATFSRLTSDPREGYASHHAASAPVAICNAALKAVCDQRTLTETET